MNAMKRKLTALIVDDEPLARRLTCEYLRSHSDVEVIGECENGLEAVAAIGTLHPDLIFLDIQMPKLSGLEVLELTGRTSGVIFTTAYDQYALKAFDFHAVDYLLKPFSQERFDAALTQARKVVGQSSQVIDAMIVASKAVLTRILVKDRGMVHIIPVEKLDYAEAQDDYINLHSEGKSILKTQRLSELEAQLNPAKFVRVHRSFIINIDKLKCIERAAKDSHVAILQSGDEIPISRAGYERIKALK